MALGMAALEAAAEACLAWAVRRTALCGRCCQP